MLKIAGALGILAAALFVISGIDSDKLGQSLGSIAVMFGELIGAMALMGKLNDTSLKPLQSTVGSLGNIARTISMIGLGAAVLILAGAMKTIGSLDWDGVKKGLVGISVLVGVLVAAARLMNTESKSITKFAGQMVILSAAVAALSGVAKILGSMSWEELAKGGAGILGIITMLVGAAKIMDSNDKAITKFAGQMLIMSVAIGVLAAVGKSISSMSWGELGKSGAAILGFVTMLVAAAKIMDSGSASITKFGGQMLLMSASLAVLVPVLKSLGSLSWESIGKGLMTMGLALAELSIGLKAMNGSLGGSAALLVAAGALAVIAPVLKSLGSMSVGSIAKSLITLAASFAVIGIAGALLTPLIPAILGLAGAFALFGIATLGIGAGMAAIAAGFTALATAGAAGAAAFVAALTVIVTGVLNLIPEIAQIIGRGIVEIAKVIGDYAPQLAESFLKLIVGVLESLEMYAPQIVDSLLGFFIGVLNSLSDHVPELIQVAMKFIGAIFQGIVDALGSIDTGNLLKGVLAVGIMTALMYALSGVVALIPSAMAGMLGVGAVIAEMAVVLAAVGALAQIPGLEWLIGEGGNLLQKIGTAIGQFVGGIAGGIMEGVTSSLPQVASDLSMFMQNLQPFIAGAQTIDPSMMEGVQALAKAILLLTAADIVSGIASFLTGGSSLSDFAKQLVPLGEGMKKFGDSVAGVDTASITASASAAKALVEVANAIPADGGLWGLLAGDKDLGSFGEKLVPFGKGMKSYATAVAGIDTASITASASAAKAIVQVADAIPAEGGLWQLIAGEKDLGSFGQRLVPFGLGMKLYSSAVAGLNSESIVASAAAAKAIVEVANAIPPEGGFWQLLSGEKDLASFGMKLVPFGLGMKRYAATVTGIDMTSITASAAAAKAIVEVANAIPPDGGFWQLLSGEKDLASFGTKLVPFGIGMKKYAEAVAGIDTASIIMSTMAAQGIVSVANSIPAEGGFWSLVDGEKDLGSFGMKLVPFGKGMKSYSEAVSGLDAAPIIASAAAAKAIVQVANAIPKEGGISSWFSGDQDLGSFGQKLVPFGKGMKSYSSAVAGLDVASITASVPAAKAMVNVANAIPSDLGATIAGIDVSGLGSKLTSFGLAMRNYSASVVGVDASAISSSVSAAKSLVSLINSTAGINAGGVSSFVNAINTLGKAQVSNFVNAFSSATPQMASAGTNLMRSLINGIRSMQGSLTSTATSMINAMANILRGRSSVFQTIGTMLMSRFVAGIRSQNGNVISAATSSIGMAASSIRGYYGSFYSAGTYLGSGLVIGIQSMRSAAYNAGYALGQAAAQGEKDGQKSRSPSKLTIQAGKWLGEGLVIGMEKMGRTVYKAGYGLGDGATNSISEAISRVGQLLDSDIDVQPTISPVIDLTNVKSGVSEINGMLDTSQSIGVMANVRSINAMMNRRNQNGEMIEVVSAINKLRKDLSNVGNTYNNNIGDITYGGDSDISTAVEALVRAARMERRV